MEASSSQAAEHLGNKLLVESRHWDWQGAEATGIAAGNQTDVVFLGDRRGPVMAMTT